MGFTLLHVSYSEHVFFVNKENFIVSHSGFIRLRCLWSGSNCTTLSVKLTMCYSNNVLQFGLQPNFCLSFAFPLVLALGCNKTRLYTR